MNLTGKITSSRMFTGHMVLWCSENIMVRYFSLKNVLFFEYDDHILILNISFYSLHLAQGSVGITRPSHDCTAKTWGWGYKMNFWMIQNKTEIFLKHLVNPQQFVGEGRRSFQGCHWKSMQKVKDRRMAKYYLG